MKTILFTLLAFLSFSASAQIVRMETTLGNIDIELHPDVAPNTVANFLKYINNGDYDNSIIHRSVDDFVIQGGGFKFTQRQSVAIAPYETINNEFSLSNVRGTIAMAKITDQPNSAQSQWFINTSDNNSGEFSLDTNNGGFTVFGTIIEGMDVVDSINNNNKANVNIRIGYQTFGFSEVPYLDSLPTILTESDAIIINKIDLLDIPLAMNIGLNGAWYNQDTSGQGILIEILPQAGDDINDLAFMAWFTFDTEAPSEDVTATIGDTGHRWMTGLGEVDRENNSITFDLTLTVGGLFDNIIDVTNSVIAGSMTINFADCDNASVTYNLVDQGLSNTFPVIRVAADTQLCQSLSVEAAREN